MGFGYDSYMKVYKVTSYFELFEKPDWLDEFRKKYDYPHRYHSSFKFQTAIEDKEIEKVKKIVEEVVSKYKPVPVVFNSYVFEKLEKGNLIMITSNQANSLYDFQKELVTKLESLGTLLSSEFKRFEKDYLLHITIARRLSDTDFEEAKLELPDKIVCKALTLDVTLTVVNDWVPEETSKPENNFVFEFAGN